MSRTPATNIDDALEDWQVDEPGMWENGSGPKGWWAVSNSDESIVAYFAKPEDAYRWRLSMENKDLNP
jgi:hypothetical protein